MIRPILYLCLLVWGCGSNESTGPILPLTTGDINAPALQAKLGLTPAPLLIFKGNMTDGSSNEDQITASLESHLYAITLQEDTELTLTMDEEAASLTVYFIEAFDRADSFSDVLLQRALTDSSSLPPYTRRGVLKALLERGQYLAVIVPSSAVRYRIHADW